VGWCLLETDRELHRFVYLLSPVCPAAYIVVVVTRTMSAIDDLLQEVKAFDYKWFDEIGGAFVFAQSVV
jgi:hypothetical protein